MILPDLHAEDPVAVDADSMALTDERFSNLDGMHCELDVDDDFLADTSPALDPSPRQRRAVAQPLRLEENPRVICYQYQHTTQTSRWQGRRATLHYFLPESWSPGYKFTVFEDSYILRR
jgi:hypothetical protein